MLPKDEFSSTSSHAPAAKSGHGHEFNVKQKSSNVRSVCFSNDTGGDTSQTIRESLERQQGEQKYSYVRNILYHVSIVLRLYNAYRILPQVSIRRPQSSTNWVQHRRLIQLDTRWSAVFQRKA